MKLQKMQAPAHGSPTAHLAMQEAMLVQKYLGSEGLRTKGYGYPPMKGEEGDFTAQVIEQGGKVGHGVPLTNFLNAQYLCARSNLALSIRCSCQAQL